MNSAEVQKRLETQASVTEAAELILIACTLGEIDAAEALRDCERGLYLEAGDKERHPELTNDKKRSGWVVLEMATGVGAELRATHKTAHKNKLLAEATYNRERRFGQHLVALVSLLKPTATI